MPFPLKVQLDLRRLVESLYGDGGVNEKTAYLLHVTGWCQLELAGE